MVVNAIIFIFTIWHFTPLSIHDMESLLNFYTFLVFETIENNSAKVLQTLLKWLCQSMRGIRKADSGLDIDSERSLSHDFWAHHRLVYSAAARGNAEILTLVLSYGGQAADIDDYDRSALHALSLSSNNEDRGTCKSWSTLPLRP